MVHFKLKHNCIRCLPIKPDAPTINIFFIGVYYNCFYITSQKLYLPGILDIITMNLTTELSTKLTITPEFKQALELLLNSSDHIYLTGKAGTGKSTLLSYFRLQTKKKIAVLAPTGVAALNIQGETIHSFFRFKSNVTVEDAQRQGQKLLNTRLYEELDAIVIDEISMVRADLIDCMDVFLRAVLNNNKDFGGLQMIWVGDFRCHNQLPSLRRWQNHQLDLVQPHRSQ